MKKKSLALLLLSLVLLASNFATVFTGTVSAATDETYDDNDRMETAQTIDVNGTVDGAITEGDPCDFYEFTVPSSGRITMKFTSYMERYGLILYDPDGNVVWSTGSHYWNDNIQKRTDTHLIDLKKGTYYLRVNSAIGLEWDSAYTGEYTFDASFQSANETAKESIEVNNDTLSTASPISVGATIKGQIANSDPCDFYEIAISATGKLSLKFISYMERYGLILYNPDGDVVWSTGSHYWNENIKKRTDTHLIDLKKGTYYLRVNSAIGLDWDSAYTGVYTFKITYSVTKPSISSVRAGKKKATVTWSRVPSVSGYEVYRATSKGGTYKNVKTVGASTRKWTNTGLKSKKTYYYKVRAYKKIDGKTYYSPFSSVRSVKVK